MYETLELSTLYKDISTSGFISTISNVLEMINSGYINPSYKVRANNITIEEEVVFKNVIKRDFDYYLDLSMMKDNMRFYYLDDVNSGTMYIRFSARSGIDTDKVNLFTSFFIGKKIKNDEEETKKMIGYIIFSKIETILFQKHNIVLGDIIAYCANEENKYTYDYINAIRSLIEVYISLYKVLDGFLDLKYEDFNKIADYFPGLDANKNTLFEIEREAYNYAITRQADSIDYEMMIKDCFKIIYND